MANAPCTASRGSPAASRISPKISQMFRKHASAVLLPSSNSSRCTSDGAGTVRTVSNTYSRGYLSGVTGYTYGAAGNDRIFQWAVFSGDGALTATSLVERRSRP